MKNIQAAQPANIDRQAFIDSLKDGMKQIVSFVSVGDESEWTNEYNQRVIECLVTSTQFAGFSDEKRAEIITTHFNLMHRLKILFGIVTQHITLNQFEARAIIDELVLPPAKK